MAEPITRVLDYRGCRVTVRTSYRTTEAGFLSWWQVEQGGKVDAGHIDEIFPTAEGALAASVSTARRRIDEAIEEGWLGET